MVENNYFHVLWRCDLINSDVINKIIKRGCFDLDANWMGRIIIEIIVLKNE